MQVQNLALAWEEVVLNAKPFHRCQMSAEHGCGNQISNRCRVVATFLYSVQRIQAQLFACRCLRLLGLVPLRNSRIQVPTKVIETLVALQGFGKPLANILERHAFEFCYSNNNVSHLHPGVVHVILNPEIIAAFPGGLASSARPQHASEAIP